MRRLGPSDFHRMPWKNGSGVTVQIAIGPPGATVDDFDWRVSTATVAASGPFSVFAGIDRTLAILGRGAMKLVARSPDSTRQAMLDADSEPYRFAGEWRVDAELIGDDEVVDFNVMTRRGRFTHHLERLDIDGPTPLTGKLMLVYCVHGPVVCHDVTDSSVAPATLVPGEALLAQAQGGAPGNVRLQLDATKAGPARLWVVQLFEARPVS